MRRRSDRSYSTSFGAGLSDGSRVTGAAAGSTTGAPPRAYDLMNAFSTAQPDPTTAKMMKSARAIVRRVESIVSPPSASPESVAPGIFSNLASRLGPLYWQQRCQAENGNKDSGTRRRPSSNSEEKHATRRRRNFRPMHWPKAEEKRGLGVLRHRASERFTLGPKTSTPLTAARKIDADYAHDARRQTWSLGGESYAGTPLEARVKGQVSGYGPK